MKKLSKILVSVLSSFAFLCAPLFLVGCSGNNLSMTEVNEVQGKAADAYFSTHTEIPTYADTTYHWKENSTTNATVTLNYKKNAADTEKVDGDFENKVTKSSELTIAVKKFGDNLICKLVYSDTTTSDGYSVAEDQTAKHTVSTTVTTRTYRLYTYVASNIVNYVLLSDASSKVDNEDAVVTKEKVVLTEADYNNLVTTLLKKTNDAIKGYFFDNGIGALILYKDFVTTQRDGDQVIIGLDYNDMVHVSSTDFAVSRTTNNFKSIFENDKVSKITSTTKMTSDRLSSQAESNFDITNSAEVDTISDISAYDLSVSTYYFEAILSSLPRLSMLV